MAQVEVSGGYVTQKKCRVFKSKNATVSNTYPGHSGVDVTAEGGYDYVVAHSMGRVVACEGKRGYNAQGSSGTASYGNYVKICHDNGYYTLYAHLRYISVSVGQTVYKGQTLGYMGNSGNAYGAHLHFEVRDAGGNALGFKAKDYLHSDLPGLSGGGAVNRTSSSGSAASSGTKKTGSSSSSGTESKSNTGNAAATIAGTEKTNVEITKVVVKSVSGSVGNRAENDLLSVGKSESPYEIIVQHGSTVFAPPLIDRVTLGWQRKSTPGTLNFKCPISKEFTMAEGDAVCFRVNGNAVFLGYVFERSRSDPYMMDVKVYDQMRYLKNKGTLAYSGKTYTQVLQMIANDYGLKCGTLTDTKYKIPQRIEDGTLFDILSNASDQTVIHAGKLYVLYDDCGKLQLRDIESMTLPLLVDADTTESYKYATSIDRDVYTKVVLASDNSETGERELYVENNTEKMTQWGVLQYYESLSDTSAAKLKATAKLLKTYYGKLHRTLTLSGCLGDIRVRGGSSLVVRFVFDDMTVQNYMVVEKVKHTFSNGLHQMDLDVSGIKGEFTV